MLGKRRRSGLVMCVLGAALGAVTACGAVQPGDRAEMESAAQSEDRVEMGSAAQPEDIVEMESMAASEQEMQQYLQQVTVRLQGPQYLGSGVVWAEEEDTLVIATAAHVARDNSPMSAWFVQGEPLETQLRYVSDQADVAFVEVSLRELEEQEILWQTARQDREVCEGLEEGQPLWIMGSIETAADRTYEGSVTQPWIYLEDFENYMLLGHAYAAAGASGGGVFTRDGILAGILCGGNEEDEIAVLPWSVMEAASQMQRDLSP